MRHRDLPIHQRFPRATALFLVGIAALAVLGGLWQSSASRGGIPAQTPAEVKARIAPVGAVLAGASGEAALAAARAATAEATNPAAAATPKDGRSVYEGLCSACHGSGIAGAPRLERAAWEARIAKGRETLYRNALQGYAGESGVMPPKGGNLELSDEDVRATVDWMLDNLQH